MSAEAVKSRSRLVLVSPAIALVLAVSVWLAAPRAAEAHGMNAGYTSLTITSTQLDLECLVAVDDLFNHFSVNADGGTTITRQEVDAAMPEVYAFIAEHLAVAVDGARVAFETGPHSLARHSSGGEFIRLAFSRKFSHPPAQLVISADPEFFLRFSPQYTTLVKVVMGEDVRQTVLSLEDPSESFVFAAPKPLAAQCLQFIRLGMEHIFLGYDHLMFLFALVILGGRLLELVKIVTAFTVAHSLTLILAALQVVTLPSRVIESGIALTIAYVAVENMVVTHAAHRWRLTFAFGLVHGFGFANVLREMGLPTSGLVASLLSFNVGVELGQVAIVAVFFPVTLWLARQRFHRRAVVMASAIIFLFGLGWFIERAFRLSFMPI